MSKNGYDMIYLAACALHGEVPDRKNILFDTERGKLFTCPDGQNVWYMPLRRI